ncbi:MAG: FAD:protein FMN transferase [Deltaproteobacteria bacterium]|nr:FAD:protein FMN transferase [Deltaproteobacteria bacterium]MBW2070394.1 FAD:protein FMN transferase [Deltaproteobacteria bacterium]
MKESFSESRHHISRRHFLALSGTLGLTALSMNFPLPSEAVKFDRSLHKVSKSRLAMGTVVNMIVFHPSPAQAEEALEESFAEINRLTAFMNRFQNNSYIGRLNDSGVVSGVPPEVMTVFAASLLYYQLSGGAFDITVKPLVDLYRESFRTRQTPPTAEALLEVKTRIGSAHLRMQKQAISFERAGMGVTLDGIAKGYIIDQAMQVLQKNRIQHALINAGGDIVVHGGKGKKNPWKIAIQNPWHRNKCLDEIRLDSGAVATSGNYEVFFDREKMFHHLISPTSGAPVHNVASVTVKASSGMAADALATAAFVMGARRGASFLSRVSGAEGLIIDKHHHKILSSGWKQI